MSKPHHKVKSEALLFEAGRGRKNWPVPGYPGLVVKIKESKMVGDDLHVWLSAKKKGKELIHYDHFAFVNPPTRVKGVVDARKALEAIVNDAVLGQIRHKL